MPFQEEQYQRALDFLYSFIDYSLTKNFQFSADKFDLSRIVKFLEYFDQPQNKFPIIHIAGTKGKGSTGAIIASVLRAAGYKVGFYTSPHLEEFTERIKINDVEISRERFVDIVERMKPAIERVKRLTTFELATALAFIYFAEERIDIGVIEVGLGGRLDATNVVNPLVAVITSLSMDHMNVLGDTIEKIAFEKAGIIKNGRPVVSSAQVDSAWQVLENTAAERSAKIIRADSLYSAIPVNHSLNGQEFKIETPNKETIELSIPLLGSHQLENALTAYATLKVIEENGFPLTDAAIKQGFSRVNWPARFEVLLREPLVVVDSAHNRDSAGKLRNTIKEYLPGHKILLVFGASDDKDVSGMLEELTPAVDRILFTQSIHPRSMRVERLMEIAAAFPVPSEAAVPLEAAVEKAIQYGQQGYAVLVSGSIFVAAGARQYVAKTINQAPGADELMLTNKKQGSK